MASSPSLDCSIEMSRRPISSLCCGSCFLLGHLKALHRVNRVILESPHREGGDGRRLPVPVDAVVGRPQALWGSSASLPWGCRAAWVPSLPLLREGSVILENRDDSPRSSQSASSSGIQLSSSALPFFETSTSWKACMRAATLTTSWHRQSMTRARRAPTPLRMPPCAPSPSGRDPVISCPFGWRILPFPQPAGILPPPLSRALFVTGLPPYAPASRPSFSPGRRRHSRRRGSRPAEPGSTRGKATRGGWTPESSGRDASTTRAASSTSVAPTSLGVLSGNLVEAR